MPTLKIVTNLSKSAIPKSFMQNIVPVLTKCLRKPEDKFFVAVSADSILSIAGTDEPGVIASIESIGNLGPKENQIISRDVTECISKELGVDNSRIFITFYNILGSNAALYGATREGVY